MDPQLQETLLKDPRVQASLQNAGEQALKDPSVQQAILDAAKERGPEIAAAVRDQVSAWAQDPALQAKAKQYAGQAAAMASQAVAGGAQMFADQISQGPAGLRVLAFAAGATSFAVCVLEILGIESVLTGPSKFIIAGFQALFAITTMLFEMPADWVAAVPGVTHYQDMIMDEARFMTRAGGRGLFYVFQAALWFAFVTLLAVVHLAAAVSMLTVGVLHILMAYGVMPQSIAQKVRYDPVAQVEP
eukprot:TRINITY_DN38228_c0_g1_i1.p1 TRINITY_DN38228_c0_g1~~TRINITY_DN38228_c0_g1_i1.p1  ORF type:complete len:252 (+),score=52.04 TRINITY_DN38228_c0_g1_i1:24-758(+)